MTNLALSNGAILRPGAGFHVWTEVGEALYRVMSNQTIILPDVYELFPKKEILERAIDNAERYKKTDKSGRTDAKIRRDAWVGECAEVAVCYMLQTAGLDFVHASHKKSNCSYDIETLCTRLEIKAFPYNSRIKDSVKFSRKANFTNISQTWNCFDIFLPVLWTDDQSMPTFSDSLKFFFWKMIDSRVFWSQLSMFSLDEEDGGSYTLDQNRATSERLLRNLI